MSNPARKITLADALAQGPLALVDALAYAVQLAESLREMHAADRAHGRVLPASIMLKPSGVELLPSRSYLDEPRRETDVRSWGAVLYEMVAGTRPPVDAAVEAGPRPVEVPKAGSPRSGPSAIRATTQRLAMKCLSLPAYELPTMQQALSEVRLLAVLARQYEPQPRPQRRTQTGPARVILQPVPAASARPINPRAAALARLAQSASPVPLPQVEPPAADEAAIPELDLASFGQPAPKKPPEPAAKRSGPCPRCHGSVIFVSKPRSSFERLLAWRGVPICRCPRCYHRWIVFARLKIGKAMPMEGARSKKVKQLKKK